MSVKQERKMSKVSLKGHSLSKKKKKLQGRGNVENSDVRVPAKARGPVVKNMVTGGTSDIKKTQLSADSENDKHKKLKNRKKFKRMKALRNEQKKTETLNKQETNSSAGDKVELTDSKSSAEIKENKKRKKALKKKGHLNDRKVVPITPKVTVSSQESVKADSPQKPVSGKKKLKRLMWKQKQMAKKLARKGLVNKQEHKQLKPVITEKVELPRNAEEATANWKKLQETVLSPKGESRKRKIPEHRIRNPKHRKTENMPDKHEASDSEDDKEPEIWFDDVDEMLLDKKLVSVKQSSDSGDDGCVAKEDNPLVKPGAFKGVTKIVCMDCEMVGVGDGSENMLARVSIVNQYGEPVYDKFVKPKETVIDYRTYVSGVRPQDLENAEDFEQVQKDVAAILKGKLLVGHAIKNDLKVLYLSHPRRKIRDTSLYKPFRQLSGGRTPSLKKLSEKVLAVKVQEGEHNSVQDAQATMRLYTMYRKQWESDLMKLKKEKRQKKGKT